MLETLANRDILRQPSLIIVLSFDHQVCFLTTIFGKRSDLPLFTQERSQKDKSVVSFTHEQNIICSQTQVDNIAHEQTIICRQLFAGHAVGFRPMKRKNFKKFAPNNNRTYQVLLLVIKRTLGPLYSLHPELSIINNVAIETGFSLYPYY